MHPGCHENVHTHRWSVLRDDVCSERVLNDVLVVSKDGEAIQTLNLGNNSSQLLFFFNLFLPLSFCFFFFFFFFFRSFVELAVATLIFSGGGGGGHSFFRRLGFSLGDAPAFDGTLRSSSSVPQTARVA